MLAQRLLVAAIGIPVLLLILVAGNPWLPLLLVVLVTAAAVETANLLSKAGFSVHPIVGGALALLIALAAASTLYGQNLLPAALVIAVVASTAYALAPVDPADRLRRLAGTILTSVIALALSTMILIALAYGASGILGPLGNWLDRGQAMLLIVVLTVWACDTAAYATGRLFPRGHFFAHISPNKTWSGAIGGFVGATLAGYLLGLLVIQAPTKGLLIGLVGWASCAHRRPDRIDAQAGGGRQGLEPHLPRPRRHPRPHGLVHHRRAGGVAVARILRP